MNVEISRLDSGPAVKSIFWSIAAKSGLAFLLFAMVGCGSPKKINQDFLYFQNSLDSIETIQRSVAVIKNNDLLSIQIFSKSLNQDQASIFNLPDRQSYLVAENGNIDLPIIGEVRASGLTKEQLQLNLKDKLSSYIKEPSVFVRFSDFKINVLGEVKLPGTHSFNKDKVTIIDAISAAGDLTDYGKERCDGDKGRKNAEKILPA
jgi:polysaccharide biosynthesis/export protein